MFAEGARGSLSKLLIGKFDLDKGREPQKYGIGIKELWQDRPGRHQPGLVQHSFGWPLVGDTGGGSFLYHFEDNQVVVGFVVHLNYKNPTLSPFDEFQRFKTHPMVRDDLRRRQAPGLWRARDHRRRLAVGAQADLPRRRADRLLGGFMNVPRIKGSHNAVLSGIEAAEAAAKAIAGRPQRDELADYEAGWRAGPIGAELKKVRNVKPLWSKLGTFDRRAARRLDMWPTTLFGLTLFGTLKHGKPDYATLRPSERGQADRYPKPDGVLSFDKLSSVFLSNTNHEEDQPIHLKLADPSIPIAQEPAALWRAGAALLPGGRLRGGLGDEATKADPRFVINAQNCVHCKTCDIKDPAQNITWTCPEGGGGPNYPNM